MLQLATALPDGCGVVLALAYIGHHIIIFLLGVVLVIAESNFEKNSSSKVSLIYLGIHFS
jgi:hypothetical protein